MPLKRRRYGKKKKYGKKKSRYSRRKYKKYGKRKRYGGKGKKRSLLRDIYKDGTKYTTIYKTGIRFTSKAGTCNYCVLDADPSQLVFRQTVAAVDKAAFMGDMSFYGNRDKIEALRRVNQDMKNVAQGYIETNTGGAAFLGELYQAANETNTTAIEVPVDLNWKVAYGTNYYNLMVKSAITGSNVHIVLYKCKARYDIPMLAKNEEARNAFNLSVGLASWSAGTESSGGASKIEGMTDAVQNLHNLGWRQNFVGQTSVDAIVVEQNSWTSHQEGTSLYDNKLWCKLFKIVKSYKAELVPGQMAKLALKQKTSILNPVADVLKSNNLCNKGQVFFVLKLQGSLGHQDQDGVEAQTDYYYGGKAARPGMALMPAAVDVLCFKKFKVACKRIPRSRVKNIIKYADYLDDTTTENLDPSKIIDAAPSDYAATPAVIS